MGGQRAQTRKAVIGGERLEGLFDLAQKLRGKRIRVGDYLKTLKGRFSHMEPEVRAFIPEQPDRFDRLQKEAETLEARFPESRDRPPLFGVPVGVKDIFHIDGFPTRAGSRLPPEVLHGPEATVVRALKEAGALILGKTVTTEFAYFGPGPTRNPHDLGRTPGGSSSGSAAAVACGLCPLALGTQTVGSIIRPAAFCGVIGFKPTYGRISLRGVIPLAPPVDHVGFFCRDVEGAVLVASLLCRAWKDEVNVGDPVIGIPEGPYLQRASEEGLASFRRTVEVLSRAGFELRSVNVMEDFDEISHRHQTLVAVEAAEVHRGWYARFSGLYHQKTVELIERGYGVTPQALRDCRDGRSRLRDALEKAMKEDGLSAWVAPAATGPAPKGIDSTGDPIMNLPWTHAGLPVVHLPVEKSAEGMPLGIQIVGQWIGDESLLGLARLLMQAIDSQ
jgi:Asp-tRNA(Asn)/Glu-tRNA(Gln) amidotransferase A subunit family amidase